jgi:hypothetical protein
MGEHEAAEVLSRIYRAIMTADYAVASVLINEYWRYRVNGGLEPTDGDKRIDNYVAIVRIQMEEDS